MGKYFDNKYCVYLDQFAVSSCASSTPQEDWREIKKLILIGIQNEQLVVPYSQEHLLESALRDAERAREQDRFLFNLSGGLSLRPEQDITARLLINCQWSHLAFSQARKLHFPLLADFEPKGHVAKQYGAYNEKAGEAQRALFVLDEEGIIRWHYRSPDGINPGADGILTALEKLDATNAATAA